MRWQHPERGLLPPGEFIPLAEDCGLIVPLTDWVLEVVCADLQRREADGLRAMPVSVNLASLSLVRDGLVDQLAALLIVHGLPAGCLTLEVTESMFMTDVAQVAGTLQRLRECGFRISLDDFGTGYSSLSYLKMFPVDELKIDRSFVSETCHSGRDGAIARSIIALGREFGLQVVAEGVETQEQASFLLHHGCAYQQGYLHAEPMSGNDFDALLRSSTRVAAAPVVAEWTGRAAVHDGIAIG